MSETELASFLQSHVGQIEELSRQVNLAYWNATISGKARDFERSAQLQVQLQRVYSERRDFERLSRWKEDPTITDELDQRQVILLHHAYLRNQIDPDLNERMTKLQSKIENQFKVYRASVNSKKATSNEILKILKESNDSDLRRHAWQAAKQVGAVVVDDLITLVKLRNEAAASLGYDNYYSMSLELGEQDENDIMSVFGELEKLTRDPFKAAKEEADVQLAARFAIKPSEMRPWHYEDPFFQEAPRVFSVDLDRYYEKHGIVDLVTRFYHGIGLRVEEILARSDLYERPGKDQHAYCTDIDRKGDIRILANIHNDETWMGTMLHELGHAVHDRYIDPSLPYILRQEAHIFTTEAIAMLFGRLSKDADWIQEMIDISDGEKQAVAEDLYKSLRLHQLIFVRWSQVMMHFERNLYIDPDQNLNQLWWQLAQEFQLLTPPDGHDFPHWASKTHIVTAPVYYHNYLLGEMLASQLGHFIRAKILTDDAKTLGGRTEVGDFLKQRIFAPGAKYRWDSLIREATGEDLSPRYFVREFVERTL
ncbi:MAG: M2 family metallopeptidase [Candidatus Krumholzibacteria bacterium]|nr:M2 family metallopeptidase [Candidatus Krumholzibacteria bacterium]